MIGCTCTWLGRVAGGTRLRRVGRRLAAAACLAVLAGLVAFWAVGPCRAAQAAAPSLPLPTIDIRINGRPATQGNLATSLEIVALLTVLALAPAILVLLTSFTRIVVVLSFVRHALSTPQVPPNQVLVGLALFLTAFTMYPTWQQVYGSAVGPYLEGRIGQQEALRRAEVPLREFMFRNTREKDLELFVSLSGERRPRSREEVPTLALVPAFVISELKTAFQLGFVLFVPFLVIDMIVATTLMSMGMLMLPPVMISLPFKVLLFVMVDGWHLITRALVQSVR